MNKSKKPRFNRQNFIPVQGGATTIGETLHNLRFRSRVSRTDLSKWAGVRTITIEAIEADDYTAYALHELIACFGVFGQNLFVNLIPMKDGREFDGMIQRIRDLPEKLKEEQDVEESV